MSWDATLYHSNGVAVFDQNYTHNCNRMIRTAGFNDWVPDNPMPAREMHALLRTVLAEFDDNPDRYRAMNPPNKWGDFDSLRDVLREMADQCELWPDGHWEISG